MNEIQKIQAEKYLRTLHLYHPVIKDFLKSGRLYYSEYTPIGGILYWLDNNPEWEAKVRKWEEETGNLVYHALHYRLKTGDELLILLYAGHNEEERAFEQECVEDGTPWCYAINLTCPEFSEYGSAAVQEAAGGLIPRM